MKANVSPDHLSCNQGPLESHFKHHRYELKYSYVELGQLELLHSMPKYRETNFILAPCLETHMFVACVALSHRRHNAERPEQPGGAAE